MTMNRLFPGSRAWVGLGLVGLSLVALAAGCGRSPGRPNPGARALTLESAKSVFMVVPGVPDGDEQLWATWAQREVNDKHLVFRLMAPAPASRTCRRLS